jgi:hypothetical protein
MKHKELDRVSTILMVEFKMSLGEIMIILYCKAYLK